MTETTRETPKYADLIADIATVAAQYIGQNDDRAYLTECLTVICQSKKVTRLDLFHLLAYVYDRTDDTEYTPWGNEAVRRIGTVYASMDKAAAFGLATYPLVICSDDMPRRELYSVDEFDTDESRALKRTMQEPSCRDHRDYRDALGF